MTPQMSSAVKYISCEIQLTASTLHHGTPFDELRPHAVGTAPRLIVKKFQGAAEQCPNVMSQLCSQEVCGGNALQRTANSTLSCQHCLCHCTISARQQCTLCKHNWTLDTVAYIQHCTMEHYQKTGMPIKQCPRCPKAIPENRNTIIPHTYM